ncbi:MAG: hypothetical protein HDS07_05755 [Bacteroides sp.]|nr:hypothetical protein [Bacteroides sp.]
MKKSFSLLLLSLCSMLPLSASPSSETVVQVDYDLTATLIHNAVIALGCTLIFIGGCIAFVWLLLHFRRRQHLDKLEVVSKSLELNRPLPKEFFHTGYRPTQRNLTGGICWVGAGLSLIVFFLVLSIPMWPIGLLLITIGISKIVGYIVATRGEAPQKCEAPKNED